MPDSEVNIKILRFWKFKQVLRVKCIVMRKILAILMFSSFGLSQAFSQNQFFFEVNGFSDYIWGHMPSFKIDSIGCDTINIYRDRVYSQNKEYYYSVKYNNPSVSSIKVYNKKSIFLHQFDSILTWYWASNYLCMRKYIPRESSKVAFIIYNMSDNIYHEYVIDNMIYRGVDSNVLYLTTEIGFEYGLFDNNRVSNKEIVVFLSGKYTIDTIKCVTELSYFLGDGLMLSPKEILRKFDCKVILNLASSWEKFQSIKDVLFFCGKNYSKQKSPIKDYTMLLRYDNINIDTVIDLYDLSNPWGDPKDVGRIIDYHVENDIVMLDVMHYSDGQRQYIIFYDLKNKRLISLNKLRIIIHE